VADADPRPRGDLGRGSRSRLRGSALLLGCSALLACRGEGATDGEPGLGAPAAHPASPAAGDTIVRIGDGLLLGEGPAATCLPICGFAGLTDPDEHGNLDGFGYEGQRACIAPGIEPALFAPRCDVTPLSDRPAPGPGIFRETRCVPVCASSRTDPDPDTGRRDGWGYERERNCIVSGSAAALGGLPCDPGEPPFAPGDGVRIAVDDGGTRECRPLCHDPASSDPDGDGFGYEHETSCVASTSIAALQGIPCDAPDLPPPPAPPPPPAGEGWLRGYTATMFGEIDCAQFGFDDPGDSDLSQTTCASSGRVVLDERNQRYFGATGDLASLWQAPPCRCNGPERAGRCSAPPSCPGQTNCGRCVELTCDFEGGQSFRGDGMTHNEL
jgi:hypothetical protein